MRAHGPRIVIDLKIFSLSGPRVSVRNPVRPLSSRQPTKVRGGGPIQNNMQPARPVETA